VKQTKFSVRYGVRSQPVPDIMFGDDTLASEAERRLAKLGERLGLSTASSVGRSPDLNADGTAKWIDKDPEDDDA
jgi:hypothetical protein